MIFFKLCRYVQKFVSFSGLRGSFNLKCYWSSMFLLFLSCTPLTLLGAQTMTNLMWNATLALEPMGNNSMTFSHGTNCSCGNVSDYKDPSDPCSYSSQNGEVNSTQSRLCTRTTPSRHSNDDVIDIKRTDSKDIQDLKPFDNLYGYFNQNLFMDTSGTGEQFVLKVLPVAVCNQTYYENNDAFIKMWKIRLPAQYILKSLTLQINYSGKSFETPKLFLSELPEFQMNLTCQKTHVGRNGCRVQFNSTLITDALYIKTTATNHNCFPPRLTNSVLCGIPICPYLYWGPRCKQRCDCACTETECHPVTGECNQSIHSCHVGYYGKQCDRKCPSHCDKNSVRGCHVISGMCKVCAYTNLSLSHFKHNNCTREAVTRRFSSRKFMMHWCRTAKVPVTAAAAFVFYRHQENRLNESSNGINRTRTGGKYPLDLFGSDPDIRKNGLMLVIVAGFLITAVVIVLCASILLGLVKRRGMRRDQVNFMNRRYLERASLRTIADFDLEFQTIHQERIQSKTFEVKQETDDDYCPSKPHSGVM